MKFDEAIEELRLAIPEKFYSPTMHDIAVMLEAQTKVINLLREEYAPTVEMTKTQYVFITSEYEQENIVDAVANLSVDDILKENFHANFWEPLTQREVVQAWLHPETIKVVDE
ncbi:hypothetical protein [Leuconostoc lactis]|uniref:hypothetical protein n=1 Tax=Leuconostoc lactis TaxID=1246 RepID=UPI003B287045